MQNVVEVVAALIWDGNKFLICQRPANKARALLWEFVGGKVEKGESLEEALARECKEELDIEIEVGTLFFEVVHEYPDITIHLNLFNCLVKDKAKIKLLEHNAADWIEKEKIDNYDFCPADTEILAEIKKIPNACDEYRHFKGNEYQVKDIAIDTRKPDLLVIYADKKTPTKIWARPFREWIETITRDGKTFSRFTKND